MDNYWKTEKGQSLDTLSFLLQKIYRRNCYHWCGDRPNDFQKEGSLGSTLLYKVNQGGIGKGQAINEQLSAIGAKTSEFDYVLLTHLDCDHANGRPLVKTPKKSWFQRLKWNVQIKIE